MPYTLPYATLRIVRTLDERFTSQVGFPEKLASLAVSPGANG
jgi:hypothetical protein